MNFVVFGLTISSSWGNGHATLWRALCKSLIKRGHQVTFFERDEPYYRDHRDFVEYPGLDLVLYPHWQDVVSLASRKLKFADVAIVTSYCPDGVAASVLMLDSNAQLKFFYDLDTPVTLSNLQKGKKIPYLPEQGLKDFDLVLSYTGGKALQQLQDGLGAKRVEPLYGSVDPEIHCPVASKPHYRSDLSYIGTYASDRHNKFENLFLKPAAYFEDRRFALAGSLYPPNFPWTKNSYYFRHLPPSEHASFFCSSRMTLNITREAMAQNGYCPSGRLFEAAATGVPILSDNWEGLDLFFTPGSEILIADSTEDAIATIQLSDNDLKKIGTSARERTLEFHTAEQRVLDLEKIINSALSKTSFVPQFSRQQVCWGIIPAAGAGTRIQPLAFSKELLPVGSRIENHIERPKAVSEYLMERMIAGGASQICFVLSPGKSDILEYYCGLFENAHVCYVVQPKPQGLCDAIFCSSSLIRSEDLVMVGLPDTVWFPENGFQALNKEKLSFLLFEVDRPELFDSVLLNPDHSIIEIQVKNKNAQSNWIWGAFQMPGKIFHELHQLWLRRNRQDEYFGTLVNAYINNGGHAYGYKAGEIYVDVGTLNGYREASRMLTNRSQKVVLDQMR